MSTEHPPPCPPTPEGGLGGSAGSDPDHPPPFPSLSPPPGARPGATRPAARSWKVRRRAPTSAVRGRSASRSSVSRLWGPNPWERRGKGGGGIGTRCRNVGVGFMIWNSWVGFLGVGLYRVEIMVGIYGLEFMGSYFGAKG